MTDPNLELAAARAMGLKEHEIYAATIAGSWLMRERGETWEQAHAQEPGGCHPRTEAHQRWRPLTDWRDTGKCLAWLRERGDVVLYGNCRRVGCMFTPTGVGAATKWTETFGDTDQAAIVRAVVAVGGSEQ